MSSSTINIQFHTFNTTKSNKEGQNGEKWNRFIKPNGVQFNNISIPRPVSWCTTICQVVMRESECTRWRDIGSREAS